MRQPEQRAEVLIGDRDSSYLLIRALGRLHPGASDYWDGNWLITPVTISVDSFTGEVGASIRAEELRGLREGLERLNHDLEGEAVLESMEGWLSLVFRMKAGGRIDISGQACDRPGGRNRLCFVIDGLDQTNLPSIIDSLELVETRFPVLAAP
ncbi:WapI family immunity protein [Micromonospora sp. CB01531]|uniref:WapI family immunity protein n=1 Tax=Micromonospora sp. CB01531 TaxID=1718947 RepID=UPI00093A084E|nr:hypothetical protein [Micromonospora sp. CB01531]